MKKNAIWAIVGLMTAALLGIIILQSYWINNAIELKREQFNDDVNTALNIVAQELQERELEERTRMEENLFKTVSEKIILDAKPKIKGADNLDFTGLGQKNEDISSVTRDYQRFRSWKPKKFEDRINRAALDELLKKELSKRNIHTNFNYKVFATFKDVPPREIISNGIFTIDAEKTDQVTDLSEEVEVVKKAEYSVPLFDNDGELAISFPKKTSVIWGAVITPLIAAILFTAIVLFCFTYTIQVILTQKKLSKMKTDFVNNMTHEFKTPIATISLAVDSITSPMILSKQDKVKRFAGHHQARK
ncbi:MAG: hypothetical protein AAF960_18855 [Bacteroidota bacterium]